jgi:hypothetical protein
MPPTQTTCPRCRQPVMAEIENVFDVDTDPKSKQKILTGTQNHFICPVCQYEGNLATFIIYHDSEKELLLTYFPPELGLPVNEQERIMGPQITKIVNQLPAEKRKAYLLQPQTMLTMETMVNRVLEADGITKEMMQNQQQRLNLLQRLISATPESRQDLIKQEESLIDQDFFSILLRLIEVSNAQGDQQGTTVLSTIQQELISQTEFGKKLAYQAKETEAAIKSLQDASQSGLTREKLLDLIISADNDIRLSTLVSLARGGMDYTFFELLTQKINQSKDEKKEKLAQLREKLLSLVDELDKAYEQHLRQAKEILEKILASDNIQNAVEANINQMDDLFIELVQSELQEARKKSDLDRINKVEQIIIVLQKYSTPPPEVELIEKMMAAADDAAIGKLVEENADKITDEFLQLIAGLIQQSETQKQPKEVIDKLQSIYRMAMRYSMQVNLKK